MDLKNLTTTELLHSAWEQKMLRDFCDLACVPDIFSSMKFDEHGKISFTQEYYDGIKNSNAMFDEIMSDPEKKHRALGSHAKHLRNIRIRKLEAELTSLREIENPTIADDETEGKR